MRQERLHFLFRMVAFAMGLASLVACTGMHANLSENTTIVFTSPAEGSYINSANKSSIVFSGTCYDIGISNVVITGPGSITVTTDCISSGLKNIWSANVDFSNTADGTVIVTATHTDDSGNLHKQSLSLTKDAIAPSVDWTLPLALACATNSSATALKVSGNCTSEDGDVRLTSPQLASPVTATCSSGVWSTTLNLNVMALSNLALFDITATQIDAAGNSTARVRSLKKLASTPTVATGGWDDIYAVGPKVYASNPSETTPNAEPGVVRITWKEWPVSNTCMPDAVKVYRASSAGGTASLVSNADFPNGIPANLRAFTDTTLVGATPGTANSATDFAKGWYYKLKVSIAGTDYDVTSPAQIAEVRVIAPPANMALMHRWIANQEVCGLMGRGTDATNHYRCDYSGWGKVAGDFYDMTTDTLIDRHELACNFTSQCGASGDQPCLSSVFENVSPVTAAVAGADGQVYYSDTSADARCWIKISGTWREANWSDGAFTPSLRAQISTSQAHKPPLVKISQDVSYLTCQGHSVTLGQVAGFTSASKRLLRNIEWKAAAAWVSNLTDDEINSLEEGGVLNTCNSSDAHGGLVTDRGYSATPAFYVGSQTATNKCQSRYGVQDMVGNVSEWTSDQLANCTTGAPTCVGINSALDAGNTFMSGFLFDNISAPADETVTAWVIESKSHGANYFSVPLGLPMMTNDGGNAISIDSWLSPTNRFHGDRFSLFGGPGTSSRGLMLGGRPTATTTNGRWSSSWLYPPTFTHVATGLRCALPVAF